ncbi:MAG TPA: porin family protein [Cellvibrionaceae bacterium]
MKKLLLAAALSTFACAASADDRFYAGGNVAFWNYTEGSQDVEFNVSSVEGVVGFNVWNIINIEGRLGLGLEGSTETVSYITNGATNPPQTATLPTKLTLDNYASIYIKPELKNDVATFYALLGYTSASASTENTNVERDLDISGLSFGLGMGFYVADDVLVNLEYRKLVQDSDFKFDGFSLGFTIGF